MTPIALPHLADVRGPFKASAFYDAQPLKTLLSKTWQAPYTNGPSLLWQKRAQRYWLLQEITYGIVLSDCAVAYDDATATITSYAVLMAKLPGERVKVISIPDVTIQ